MTKSKELKVGIAYEGGLDTEYVIALVRRMLAEKNFSALDIDSLKAGTAITKFVPAYATRFKQDSRDVMVYLTDSDGGANTKAQIVEKIKLIDETLVSMSAVGIPDPHLERWILGDEDAVKKVFGFDGSLPLPHSKLKPKERLIAFYEDSKFEGTPDDAKLLILEHSKLNIMASHCADFRLFKEEFDRIINLIDSQQTLNV